MSSTILVISRLAVFWESHLAELMSWSKRKVLSLREGWCGDTLESRPDGIQDLVDGFQGNVGPFTLGTPWLGY